MILELERGRKFSGEHNDNRVFISRNYGFDSCPLKIRGKIKANNMADIEEEILLQANLLLLLVLKRRQVSFKT